MVEEVVNVLQPCFSFKIMSCVINSAPNIITQKKKSHMKHAQINLMSSQQPPILWYVLEYHNMKDESQSQTWDISPPPPKRPKLIK